MMAPNVGSTPDIALKKDRTRRNVIIPVVPVIPKVAMSRKERRKSKQLVNGIQDADNETVNDMGKGVGSQEAPAKTETTFPLKMRVETADEKVESVPSGPSEREIPAPEAEPPQDRQGKYHEPSPRPESAEAVPEEPPQSPSLQASKPAPEEPPLAQPPAGESLHEDTVPSATAQPQASALESLSSQPAATRSPKPQPPPSKTISSEPVPTPAPQPQKSTIESIPSKTVPTPAHQPSINNSADNIQSHPHLTRGGHAASSGSSSAAPPTAMPNAPYQQPVLQYPVRYPNDINKTQLPQGLLPHFFPMEYGYPLPSSQPRPIVYPSAPVPYPAFHGYNPRVPSFYPPENHSPYSPTETPSGRRSEPWSVPNYSATSNSSVDPDVKLESKALAVSDDATVTFGGSQKPDQNEIMHAVKTAEVVPIPDPIMNGSLPDDEEDGILSLPMYLLSMFHTGAHTDWSLTITSPRGAFEHLTILFHALIAARSPFLQAQLRAHYDNQTGTCNLVFNSFHRFLRPSSFRLALQRLYGDSLLQNDTLAQLTMFHAADGNISSSWRDQMEFALGYSVAGNLLQLPGVERRGLHLAAGFLDWSTLELALTFELTGDVKSWVKTNNDAGHSSTPRSGASQRSSSMSDTNSYHQVHDGRRVIEVTSGSLAEPPFANEVSKAAFNYMITNFPVDFQLDTGAVPEEMPDRFPRIKVSRPSKARLTSIRFGNFLSEDEKRISTESQNVSRILLTVPFEMLDALLGGLKGKITKSTAILLIDEREKRRAAVLNSKSGPEERMAKDSDWYAVGWEESIKEMDGEEFELTRTPKGLQEPSEKQTQAG